MATASLTVMALALLCVLAAAQETPVRLAEPWQSAYQGDDVTGDHVIALWSFDAGAELQDAGGKGLQLKLTGAQLNSDGRFGGCLESFPGWPVEDVNHGARLDSKPAISLKGAFTIEMWLKPKPEFEDYPDAFLIDKKYVSHTDYQIILAKAGKDGKRQLKANLGYGADSVWYLSDAALYETGVWHHIAFIYDGAGNGRFYRDGTALGGTSHPERGPIAPGSRYLTIGDRNGSLYHGFPGFIDQVRISNGALEFRPAAFTFMSDRKTYVRMEPAPQLQFTVTNMLREPLGGAVCRFALPDVGEKRVELPELAPGAVHTVQYPLDTSLRPGEYAIHARFEIPGDKPYVSTEQFAVTIVPRPLPRRMPVVMWGVGGVDNVLKEVDRLKDIGFTHCLGTGMDFKRVWDASGPTLPASEEQVAATKQMLDTALANDLRVMAGLSPGRWARDKEDFKRVDRNGKRLEDVNGLYPEIREFCYNVGASDAQAYGRFPAFDGAMVHTEVRGESETSFSEVDKAAFRKFAGYDIPAEVGNKYGVLHTSLKEFPADRVIPDDYPLYVYYKWFWKEGDGWNALHTALDRGLKSVPKDGFWTFHDPACRVASVWGSGGEVDYLSHWTYSYPDPIRIGLCTDELFAMAAGSDKHQRVMKMTQIIWYRSQTAPMPGTEAQVADAFFDDQDRSAQGSAKDDKSRYRARWEREMPDAAFITIAPMHLREAFWTKMSRPIQGIMYHGWQSLVYVPGSAGYRYTNPATKDELHRLVKTVVEPLGPALMQVPDRPADVAFLESFASQMFARRGTYGWNGGWAGDVYLILHYAHLQPQVIYDETVQRDGLDQYKVLVMADCDVLTRSVADKVEAFQAKGGIVIGDERLCPAIKPDILIQSYQRSKQADMAKNMMLEQAESLRDELDPHYARYGDSSDPNVMTRLRQYGSTDYLFAVNDAREFGDYVGHHGLVMENGLPTDASLVVRRKGGFVYDLLTHREVKAQQEAGALKINTHLGPCDGRVFMITDRAIAGVSIEFPATAKRGQQASVQVAVLDDAGKPIDAIIPVRVRIADPEGRPAEFSGYYGAKDGKLSLALDIAANDTAGVWEIEVEELASGATACAYCRVLE